jgi:putative transposase
LDAVGYPYLYIDATYVKARCNHRVRSRAVAIATAVSAEGRREVLGFRVGDGEDRPWEDFLASLTDRGLAGVKLVISDAHAAIKAAVQTRLPGAAFKACRIHFGRNIARRAGSRQKQRVAMAAFSSIYHQADREMAVTQYHWFATAMERVSPRLCAYVEDREVELTAYADFPPAHSAQDLVDQSSGAVDGRDQAPQPGGADLSR